MKKQPLLFLLSLIAFNLNAQQSKVFTTINAFCVDLQTAKKPDAWGKLKKGDVLYTGDKIRVYDSSYVTLLEPKGALIEWKQSGDFYVDSLPKSGKEDKDALAMYEAMLNEKTTPKEYTSLLEAIYGAKPVQWQIGNRAWLLHDKVKLRWNSEEEFVLKITDMSGKLLKEQKVSGGLADVNFETVSSFPKQYVLLNLYTNDNEESVSAPLAIYYPGPIEKDEKIAALTATQKRLSLSTAAGQMAFATWAESNDCFIEAAEAKAKAKQLMGK